MPKKIAIICSFNLDLINRQLREVLGDVNDLFIYTSPYAQYHQMILDKNSALYQSSPDVVFLFLDGQDYLPYVTEYMPNGNHNTMLGWLTESCSFLKEMLDMLIKQLPQAMIFVHSFSPPPRSIFDAVEAKGWYSPSYYYRIANKQLHDYCNSKRNVFLIDQETFVAGAGYAQLYDERLWQYGRMRLGGNGIKNIATLYAGILKTVWNGPKKVLVLDLDNTLWGEVAGDGPIVLGHDGEGFAFYEFQKEILNLYSRGILLAANSKNTEAVAFDVIDNHPDMLLKRRYFATMLINWNDKASNLRTIAEELNVGLDSLVFMDDNPVECAWVRNNLPQVLTVQLPEDPTYYVKTLLDLDCFVTLSVTEEDKTRGEMYHQEAERQEHKKQYSNLDDFLSSLEMKATISKANQYTLPRISQLTLKTNQFNMTTKRYTEDDLTRLLKNDWIIYSLALEDKFGDNGLVAVAIINPSGSTWMIDSFLMSCRVMSRGVETAFLSFLSKQALSPLVGQYIPTPKNEPAKDLYEQHGFMSWESLENGWVLGWKAIECPTYIKLEYVK